MVGAHVLRGLAHRGHRITAIAPITAAARRAGEHTATSMAGAFGSTGSRSRRSTSFPGSRPRLISVASAADAGAERHPERALACERRRDPPSPSIPRSSPPRPASQALRARLGLPGDRLVVIHASNLKATKRPLELVRLAAAVRDPRLVYVVVGDGPLREEIERQCRRHGVLRQFRFAGWVPHECVAEYLGLADMVVMPSESEGQCLVHLETQACGRLLIASDTPGAREVVEHGKTGLLFRKDSLEDLVSVAKRALADPSMREAIGRTACIAARRRAIDRTVSGYERPLSGVVRAARTESRH